MATTIRTVTGATEVEIKVESDDVTTWAGDTIPNRGDLHTLVDATMATTRALGYTTTDLHQAITKQIAVDEERRLHG
ncbi:hypothetical protein ASF48_05000 [Rathayibacter sp. Leaf299]|uniref:hypothetical protein n=1 Tax=Rathayibacter sp. Leaf299 TaxID=1736328 RepID=UPI0006F8B985|nr:hypothetical protein [Rathayibacter sp. Leaf299]KQQ22544.1 hypothetical protein ASF48_05000 [Rathayibacter sp. Leaf299]